MTLKNYVLFSVLFVSLIFLFPSIAKAVKGEPVPGAEIYVELEPDDEPIAYQGRSGNRSVMPANYSKGYLITDTNGTVTINYKNKKKITLKTIKFNQGILNDKINKNEQFKKAGLNDLQISITMKFDKNPNPIKIAELSMNQLRAQSGPYSQSVSNLDDNIIIKIELGLKEATPIR